MKLIKLLSILVFSLLCVPFSHAMEAPVAESKQHSTQVQLTDLPRDVMREIINQRIDQAQTLKKAWEFIQNLALTNRQFAALTRDTTLVNTLAQKVKDPQQELFDLARTKGKIGDIAALINIAALIKAGADVDKQDISNSGTALMFASFNGHEVVVKELLRAGADVDKHNNNGWTALMCASLNGHEAVVRELLRAGADINKTILGQTALNLAKTPAIKGMLQQAMEKQSQSNNNNNE